MTEHLPTNGIAAPPLPRLADRPPDAVRPGASCPNCEQGKLDYNGLLELECPNCGYIISEGGGCS